MARKQYNQPDTWIYISPLGDIMVEFDPNQSTDMVLAPEQDDIDEGLPDMGGPDDGSLSLNKWD